MRKLFQFQIPDQTTTALTLPTLPMPMLQLDILANGTSSCIDTFTNLPVPYYLYADSPTTAPGTFMLTPVTKMAEWKNG
jgi:hypothetical protein